MVRLKAHGPLIMLDCGPEMAGFTHLPGSLVEGRAVVGAHPGPLAGFTGRCDLVVDFDPIEAVHTPQTSRYLELLTNPIVRPYRA